MISSEECQYHTYIGQFYSGKGEAIELGPWLGRFTFYILQGLRDNPNFAGRKLRVYDDFVWRPSWMNNYVDEAEKLGNHQDFRFLHDQYTAAFQQYMSVERRKITTYDGNDDVPYLAWNGEPVEIMYVDCGRMYQVNEAWYQIFYESFIPNRTLIIMQDWRLQFEVPVRWYNQTKQFTDSRGSEQLIHELKNGSLATFLFRGAT